jgi:hypothetical protein
VDHLLEQHQDILWLQFHDLFHIQEYGISLNRPILASANALDYPPTASGPLTSANSAANPMGANSP